MRTIAVATTSRADWGYLRPVARRIAADPELELRILVGGMHLPARYGRTIEAIEADGFRVAAKVDSLLATDSPEAVAKSIGLGVVGFAQELARERPDLLVVLGDRFEAFAIVAAALPLRIPVAHLHGGERSEGAIDESFRHAITKMSHLHFVATETYARRVVQLGEEPWRVTVSGAPSLDDLREVERLPAAELGRRFDLDVERPFLLVTVHPETITPHEVGRECDELLAALDTAGLPVVFTMPNADAGGSVIRERIGAFLALHPTARAVESLGTSGYFAVMERARAMVGNSSSGIIEAASFGLPVVDVGGRQEGRLAPPNVENVPWDRERISRAIAAAVDPERRRALAGLVNPYGDGTAAEKICARLRAVVLDDVLLRKRFHDLPAGG